VVAVRDEEWGRVVSEVQLRPELADGLLGIEQFSHVVVLFVMHQARFDAVTHLTRRPRAFSSHRGAGAAPPSEETSWACVWPSPLVLSVTTYLD